MNLLRHIMKGSSGFFLDEETTLKHAVIIKVSPCRRNVIVRSQTEGDGEELVIPVSTIAAVGPSYENAAVLIIQTEDEDFSIALSSETECEEWVGGLQAAAALPLRRQSSESGSEDVRDQLIARLRELVAALSAPTTTACQPPSVHHTDPNDGMEGATVTGHGGGRIPVESSQAAVAPDSTMSRPRTAMGKARRTRQGQGDAPPPPNILRLGSVGGSVGTLSEEEHGHWRGMYRDIHGYSAEEARDRGSTSGSESNE